MLSRIAGSNAAARVRSYLRGARTRATKRRLKRNYKKRNRGLFGLSIATHVALWIFVGLVVIAITLFLFWISFDKPHLRSQAAKGVGPTALFNAAKLALAVVAGIGAVVALVVAFRRQRLGEADHERQDRATARDETRLFTERFARATEQLGSDQAAVRVAGVYALAGLADDWPTGRQTCVDVLCAYLRMPFQLRSPFPEYEPELQQDKQRFADLRARIGEPVAGRMAFPASEEHQVRSTILRAMRERMTVSSNVQWSGLNLDFTGAVFDEARFNGFIFDECDLQFGDCIFVGETTFAASQFFGGDLSFTGATFLSRLDFESAMFVDSEITLFGDFGERGYVSFQGSTMLRSELKFLGPKRGRGRISFISSIFDGGKVIAHVSEMGGESSIAFSRSIVIGATIDIHGGTFGGGSVRFNGVIVEDGGLIAFRPDQQEPDQRMHRGRLMQGGQHTQRGRMKFAGTELSLDGVVLHDGSIRFDFIDVEGSVIHFDDLEMTGGAIRFVEVDLKSGSVRMERPDVTGGSIDLGAIAGTVSGRAIASNVGEFLRPVAPLEDVE